ncbi:reverse transcriptase domain-containing protein [Tanacetum coccineum]|uniref:Reverse transcriptase domain-containing protein n=1 Tax=Tanacetum coccineum TaxID=301880 RepID=A0ABQ5H273_9ASTR
MLPRKIYEKYVKRIVDKRVPKLLKNRKDKNPDSNNAGWIWIAKYLMGMLHQRLHGDPWSNVKAMMTNEYCPATKIQRMKQELLTLTLKGDDIEAYNNRFHELVLMCPELVSTERKRLKSTFEDFPRESNEMLLLLKPETLNDE